MLNFVKGIIIGVALVIPGLSGSIFAVVMGLYDRLLAAVNHFKADPKQHLRLLVPVALGVVVGILLSTKATLIVTERWPLPAYGFFIGLVLGIAPFLKRKVGTRLRPHYLLLAMLGFIVIFGLAQLGGATGSEKLVAISRLSSLQDAGTMGFAGVFAVSLMAIPGISGSIMLMVIDQYGTVYHAVASLADAASALLKGSPAAFQDAVGSVLLLLPFMLGAFVGLLAVAKLMGYLLAHFETAVYAAVVGIVLAAVVILAQTGIVPNWPGWSWSTGLSLLISISLGVLATVFLDKPAA